MTILSPDEVRARVRHLPALPSAVSELIASLDDERVGATGLSDCISRDLALAAKTLRLANSSFYGVSRRVVSVADATVILGVQTVRSVAIAAGLAGCFAAGVHDGLCMKAFWRHAMGTAICARTLASARRMDCGAAFVLGLLHDVGRLALASHFTPQFAAALACQREHDMTAADAEFSVLGTDHAAVGALIAEHWHFPASMVEAIALHHAPPVATQATLLDVVHVADNIAHALELSHQADEAVPPLSIAAWTRMGLDEARCLPMFRQIEAEHAGLCAALL